MDPGSILAGSRLIAYVQGLVFGVLLLATGIAWAEEAALSEASFGMPDLNGYIEAALLANGEIHAAEENWRAAVHRAEQAGAPPDPRFSYGYYVTPVETRVGPQRHRFALAQTFPWLGRLSLKERQAVLEAEAVRIRIEEAQANVIRRVKDAYFEYAYAGRAIAVTRGNIELLRYLERVTEDRYKAGLSSYAQFLRIQVELARLEDRLRSLEDLLLPLQASLNAAMSRPSTDPLPLPDEIPILIADRTDEEIAAALPDGNPELRALQIQAEAAATGAEFARKGYFPDVTLGLEFIQTDKARVGSPDRNGDDPLVATVSFNIPLWFDARKAAVEEARSREASFKRQNTGAYDRLGAALQLALFKYRDAGRRISLFRNSLLPKAEQGMAATLDAFQTGGQSVLDLIDAERTLLEFQLSYLRAVADQGQYLAEMESLLGQEIPCRVQGAPVHLPGLERAKGGDGQPAGSGR